MDREDESTGFNRHGSVSTTCHYLYKTLSSYQLLNQYGYRSWDDSGGMGGAESLRGSLVLGDEDYWIPPSAKRS